MLPTFVIGLREGLEATLIVVIIATFLSAAGRRDSLRAMWTGVGVAVLFCIGFGIALQILDENLPQIRQEQLETVVALVAAAAVTYMIVWMRRHARNLRGDLQLAVEGALARGSGRALVGMAFFAIIREGLETAVFLTAAFQQSARPALTGSGAILGVFTAVAARRRHLPRRSQHQPRSLLPVHRRRPRSRRGRPDRLRAAHGPRGRLDLLAPGRGGRPDVARAARIGSRLAPRRRPRPPAHADEGRSALMARLRRADDLLRPLAHP